MSPVLLFRVVLAAMMLSTLVGVWFAGTNRPAFQAAFPGAARTAVYVGLLGTGGVGLVALAGLWRWRRWALVLYGFVAVVGIVLDLLAAAPILHQITVVAGALIVFTLAYANRRQFRAAAPRGAG
jgi:hypothetical protein